MKYLSLLFISFGFTLTLGAQNIITKKNALRLIKAYPLSDIEYRDDYLIVGRSKKIKYKESDTKQHKILINSNNIGDIFAYSYPKGIVGAIPKNQDAGRIRNEEFLKSMYGSTPLEVERNLVTITWCENLLNQRIRITRKNGVDKQLEKISKELDKYPKLKKYLRISGSYNWRKVRGSERLSSHSFGIAIDLSIAYSNFWQWDCRCINEEVDLAYKNRIPQIIVEVFEKHGFIWGGKWYHYDTMHFEYRPELLID